MKIESKYYYIENTMKGNWFVAGDKVYFIRALFDLSFLYDINLLLISIHSRLERDWECFPSSISVRVMIEMGNLSFENKNK